MSGLAFAVPPPYADVPNSWQDTDSFNTAIVNTRVLEAVPGEFWLYPLTVTAAFNTSAAVGNREVIFIILDQGGNQVARQAPATVQAASLGYVYTWSATTGVAYFDGVANMAAPLPPFLIPAGYSYGVQVNNVQAGDAFVTVVANVVKIPTGPEYKGTPVAPVPTPLFS